MDMGETALACSIASIPFWIAVAVYVWRHPKESSGMRLGLIRWGMIPVMIGGVPLAYPLAMMIGLRLGNEVFR